MKGGSSHNTPLDRSPGGGPDGPPVAMSRLCDFGLDPRFRLQLRHLLETMSASVDSKSQELGARNADHQAFGA
eukprot:1420097-Alexandrium_andersonii.AAC.1